MWQKLNGDKLICLQPKQQQKYIKNLSCGNSNYDNLIYDNLNCDSKCGNSHYEKSKLCLKSNCDQRNKIAIHN